MLDPSLITLYSVIPNILTNKMQYLCAKLRMIINDITLNGMRINFQRLVSQQL